MTTDTKLPAAVDAPDTTVKHRNRYTKEFRHDMALLVVQNRRRATDVAREFNISQQTLGNWIRKARAEVKSAQKEATVHPITASVPLTNAERNELENLRAQNSYLARKEALLREFLELEDSRVS